MGRAWTRIFNWLKKLPLPNNLWSKLVSPLFFLTSRTVIRWDKKEELFLVQSGQAKLFVARRRSLGYYLKGIETRLRRLQEQYGLEFVPLRANALAIDIGSNVGEFSMLLSQSGLEVIAFEPDPVELKALTLNLPPTDTVSGVALWNEDGLADFFCANEHSDSSLIKPNTAVDTPITVQTRTLDSFLAASPHAHKQIQVVKLEAEGAEPEILEGGRHTLQKVEWVLADVGFERGVLEETTMPAVVNLLLPFGFELVAVHKPRLVAIFKNSRLLKARGGSGN